MIIPGRKLNKVQKILDMPVMNLPGTNEILRMREMVHSSFCMGSAGSGKTSGFGTYMLFHMLRHKTKPGGTMLCVKNLERERLIRIIRAAGREADLVEVNFQSQYKMNGLQYELTRPSETSNYNHAVDFLMEIFLMAENSQAGGSSGGENERFWDSSMRRRLKRGIVLLVLAGVEVSMENLYTLLSYEFNADDLIRYEKCWAILVNPEHGDFETVAAEYEAWKESNFFLQVWDTANARIDLNEEELKDLNRCGDYFLRQWIAISDQTRAIVTESIMSLLEPFQDGILASHFSGEMSEEVKPEQCLDGKIILVSVPMMEHGIASVYANGIAKRIFQLCMQRRIPFAEENPRPTFLYVDEYHYFVSASGEKFVSSCRETLTAGIYLTQSIMGLKVSLGKDMGHEKTMSLLNNLGTKCFCQNTCTTTNTYAADIIGREDKKMRSFSIDTDDRGSTSYRNSFRHTILPETFTTLKNGGRENKYRVQTIFVVSGKQWKSGLSYAEVVFYQRFLNKSIFHQLMQMLYEFLKKRFSGKAKLPA